MRVIRESRKALVFYLKGSRRYRCVAGPLDIGAKLPITVSAMIATTAKPAKPRANGLTVQRIEISSKMTMKVVI